jgi:hypothetical protein
MKANDTNYSLQFAEIRMVVFKFPNRKFKGVRWMP